jgi:hypothetical protein
LSGAEIVVRIFRRRRARSCRRKRLCGGRILGQATNADTRSRIFPLTSDGKTTLEQPSLCTPHTCAISTPSFAIWRIALEAYLDEVISTNAYIFSRMSKSSSARRTWDKGQDDAYCCAKGDYLFCFSMAQYRQTADSYSGTSLDHNVTGSSSVERSSQLVCDSKTNLEFDSPLTAWAGPPNTLRI